jgi:hypothetical protein
LRRVLCAVAVLALFVGGCTKSQPAPAPSPSPTASPSPSPSPSPPPPTYAALTGEEVGEAIDRPILALKVDNAPAALPPDGLQAADVVIEEEVEGGLTRSLALYHSQLPRQVGPIRSGRESDAELLPAYEPVLGYSGAALPVQRMLREAGITFYEEGQAGDSFFRVSDRRAPHNLFARPESLIAAGDDLPVPDAEPIWRYRDRAPTGGERAKSAALRFSPYLSAAWTWDKGSWERTQNGRDHVTAADKILTADNVVIMRVETSTGGRRDSAGNPTLTLDVIGRGEATILRDGKAYEGRWRKDAVDKHLHFRDADGDLFELKPGRTWIEMLPTKGSLTVE